MENLTKYKGTWKILTHLQRYRQLVNYFPEQLIGIEGKTLKQLNRYLKLISLDLESMYEQTICSSSTTIVLETSSIDI